MEASVPRSSPRLTLSRFAVTGNLFDLPRNIKSYEAYQTDTWVPARLPALAIIMASTLSQQLSIGTVKHIVQYC